MLSFIREPGAGDPSANQKKNGGQQPSKGSEDNGSLEYLTVATTSKSLQKSTILVAILVAIGLVCLWFMIRRSQPQAASAKQTDEEQTKMEAAIGRLTGISSEMVSKMDQILDKFYEFSGVFQVQVGELVKNPFQVEGSNKDLKVEVTSQAAAGADADPVRRQHLKQRAGSLSLLSVMKSGQASCCLINDKLLRQGDMIEGFVITRIGSDSVELAWGGDGNPASGKSAETEAFTIVLKLSQ